MQKYKTNMAYYFKYFYKRYKENGNYKNLKQKIKFKNS